jgi:hypothetical protein
MKRHIRFLAISTVIVMGMVSSSSLSAQEKEWSLVGTWVNPNYIYTGGYYAKAVFGSDNTIQYYERVDSPTPIESGTFVIEDDWTESAIHWFKVKESTESAIFYGIYKLTNGGNSYEEVMTTGQYPVSFDQKNFSYEQIKRTRQLP